MEDIFDVASDGSLAELRQILDEYPDIVNELNEDDQTPLLLATLARKEDNVRELLRRGADPMIGDENDITPLHVASENGLTAILQLILEVPGINVDAKGALGWTPLHGAAMAGRLQSTKLLIRAGADINAVNEDGGTPLSLARHYQRPRIEKLIEATAALKNLNSVSQLRRATLKNRRGLPNNTIGVVGSFLSGERAAETSGPHRGRVRKETLEQQRKRLRDMINAL